MECRYDAGLCATALLASASERFVGASPRSTSGMSYAQSVRTSGVGRSLHYADGYGACKSEIFWMGSRGDASPSCGTFADSVAHIAVLEQLVATGDYTHRVGSFRSRLRVALKSTV